MLTIHEARQRGRMLFERGANFQTKDAPRTLAQALGTDSTYQNEQVHEKQYKYSKRGWAYASIRPIAMRVAAQQLRLARMTKKKTPASMEEWQKQFLPSHLRQSPFAGLEPLTSHPLLSAVQRPNPLMTQWALMWMTMFSLEATGKYGWWFRETKDGLNIWPIPAHWIEADRDSAIRSKWKITPPGRNEPFYLTSEEFCYFSFPDPADPLGSAAPLEAAARPILSDDAIHEAQYQGFQNGNLPTHAFIVGERVDADGVKRTPEITPDQRKELEARLNQLHGGPRKHGKGIILDGLIRDVKRLSAGLQEMDFQQSGKMVSREIQQMFGVNPVLMGENENANRASSVVADETFLRIVLNPALVLIGQTLTIFLHESSLFNGDENLVAYYEEVTTEDPEEERIRCNFALINGAIDIDTYRARILRLPPLPNGAGKIARVNITLVDVPINERREPLAEPTVVPPNPNESEPEKRAKAVQAALWTKEHGRQEAQLVTALKDLLVEQANSVAEAVRNGAVTAEAALEGADWNLLVKTTVKPLLMKAAYAGAGIETSVVKLYHPEKDIEDWIYGLDGRVPAKVTQYIDELLSQSYWGEIGTGIENDLRLLLHEYAADGLDSREMADRLRDHFTDMALPRAQRIARTELNGAMNSGSHAVREELADDGVIVSKEWNSILDLETRGNKPSDDFNHIHMDGQTAGVREDFNIDGEFAPFPGHYSLSAANRCNCRCFVSDKTVFG